MKKVLIVLLGIIILSLYYVPIAQTAEVKKNLKDFDSISLNAPFKVFVVNGEGQSDSLSIKGNKEHIKKVNIEISNNKLILTKKGKESFFNIFGEVENSSDSIKNKRIEIFININKLKELTNKGSGIIKVEKDLNADRNFQFNIEGSGDIRAKTVTSQNVEINLVGKGDLKISDYLIVGKKISLKVTGTGDANLSDVKAGSVDILQTGEGDIDTEIMALEENINILNSGRGNTKIESLSSKDINIELKGDGYCFVDYIQKNKNTEVRLKSTGNSDIEIGKMETEKLIAEIEENGEIEIKGKVKTQELSVGGLGEYKGSELVSRKTLIKAQDKADITVNVKQEIRGILSRMTTLEIFGFPKEKDIEFRE